MQPEPLVVILDPDPWLIAVFLGQLLTNSECSYHFDGVPIIRLMVESRKEICLKLSLLSLGDSANRPTCRLGDELLILVLVLWPVRADGVDADLRAATRRVLDEVHTDLVFQHPNLVLCGDPGFGVEAEEDWRCVDVVTAHLSAALYFSNIPRILTSRKSPTCSPFQA